MQPVKGNYFCIETTAGSLSCKSIYMTGNKCDIKTILSSNSTAIVIVKYKELSVYVTIIVEV